jgi:septum formation protein
MIVLASTSLTRLKILKAAGVSFTSEPPTINEQKLQNLHVDKKPAELALLLSQLKAQSLTIEHPNACIIGVDQTLELEGLTLHKAQNIDEARQHLLKLKSKTHCLHTAYTIVKSNHILRHHLATATLTMRAFSNTFLESYLNQNRNAALSSVGCYHFEDQGIQLFETVVGDHYTILGLPLLPLLKDLRDLNEIST